MEILLLALSILALVSTSDPIHLILMLLHMAAAVWIAWSLKAKQPFTAIFVISYAAFYFVNPIAVLAGWIDSESTERALYLSNFLMMAGLDLFVLGAKRLRLTRHDAHRMPRFDLQEYRVDIAVVALLAVFACALAIQLVGVKSVGGRSAFDLQKAEFMGVGKLAIFYMIARYASFVLPMCAFLVGLKKLVRQIPFLLLILLLMTLHFLVFRVRQIPISVMAAYIIAMVAKHTVVTVASRPLAGSLPRMIRYGLLASLPILALSAVSIRYMRAYIHSGWGWDADRAARIGSSTFSGGDLGVALLTRKAVELFPAKHPYLGGDSIYRLLVAPIPRAIWPNKPGTTQRIFAGLLDSKYIKKNTTIPCGIVGDLYINFGPWGVVGMIVWGFIFGLERYRSFVALLMLAACGTWLFHFTRGSQVVPVVVFFVTTVMAFGISAFLQPKRVQTGQPLFLYWYYAPAPQGALR